MNKPTRETDEVPLVTGANGKTRKPRQGDDERPQCKGCSSDEHPVFCAAISTPSPYYTYYQCPVCKQRFKQPRYEALKRMQRQPLPPDYSAR